MPEDTLSVTLTLEELMIMPGDAIIRLIDKAKPGVDLLNRAREYESRPLHGKGRWVVINFLRTRIADLAKS